MLGSPKDERMRPKGVKNYKFIKTSGNQDGLSPKMAPAPRGRESGILKDSGHAFSGQRSLWAGLEDPEGKDNDLSTWNVV